MFGAPETWYARRLPVRRHRQRAGTADVEVDVVGVRKFSAMPAFRAAVRDSSLTVQVPVSAK